MTDKAQRLQGLYVLTDAGLLPPAQLLNQVEQAILGGSRIVQYRDKHADPQTRQQQAQALRQLCREYEVCFIVNDDIDLARSVAADGVHLGKDDAAIEQARAQLGEDAIIGISCYNSLELAADAAARGADYIAFGSFFASSIKPDAVRADLGLLQEAHRQLDVPIAAIGGITTDNASALLESGAHMLAVISAVFAQPDVRQAAASFATLFNRQPAA